MSTDTIIARDELETAANVQRSRLGRSLEILTQRWHLAFDVKRQARRSLMPILLVGAGVAAGAGVSVYNYRHRRPHLLADRLRAVARIWKYPNRVARSNARPLSAKLGRWVGAGVAAFVMGWLAKGALTKLVGRPSAR